MNPPDLRAIRFRLTLPCTQVGLGTLSFDPVAQVLGMSVQEVLESLLEDEPSVRPSASGPSLEVFPLALPNGEGASVALGALGELGLFNDGGLLLLTVPLSAVRWVQECAGTMVVRGPERRAATQSGGRVAELWLRLRPGARVSLPLGLLGELGLEAA